MDVSGLVLQYLNGEIDIATFADRFSAVSLAVAKSGDPELNLLYRNADELFWQGYDDGLPIEDFRLGLGNLVSAYKAAPVPRAAGNI